MVSDTEYGKRVTPLELLVVLLTLYLLYFIYCLQKQGLS